MSKNFTMEGRKMKYSRQNYLNHVCTHREYYAQFVDRRTLVIVEMRIGLKSILASTDEHMNDIDLSRWDKLHGLFPAAKSLSDTVCIAKEAARQLQEKHRKED